MAGPSEIGKWVDDIPVVGLDVGTFAVKGVVMEDGGTRVRRATHPTAGRPIEAARACLEQLLGPDRPEAIRLGLVGAHAILLAPEGERPMLGMEALLLGLGWAGLETQAVLSLGHENMYYFEVNSDGSPGFFNRNGQCAAGSGAFWYQQATRMGFDDRGLAELALGSENAVRISGRCAIFAKSDMTHAINDGATQSAVSAGLARTLAEMIVSGVCQNRLHDRDEVLLVGGVAGNEAIVKHLRECCPATKVVVPEGHEFFEALGACIAARDRGPRRVDLEGPVADGYVPSNPLPRLDPAGVRHSPDLQVAEVRDLDTSLVFLGVDCGSVSTKCVLLDRGGKVIGGIYLPTSGRPALQVLELIHQAGARFGELLAGAEVVACTTGSGRFLSQKMLSAEYATDEITCQAEGVKSLCGEDADLSVIEIGGEDGKFLQLRHGVLHDYNMNPVCAAGTGSFLENLAGLLGVEIKGEFSRLAFEAPYAIDLGDTCTLLSQSALASAASQGLPLTSQLASLAYSSARNYLRKTAENRPMEGKVVFTGATARNTALASAFAAETGREIIIAPSPELTGALGAALMAARLWRSGEKPDQRFRGFDQLQEFTRTKRRCSAKCEHEHNCVLDVISFPGSRSIIYGDRCGRYSGLGEKGPAASETLPDYAARRNKLFYAVRETKAGGPRVGLARGGLFFDLYPFWAGFFGSLGAELVVSGSSSRDALHEGKSQLAAELCYPAEVLVGHHKELLDSDLDYVFLPEVIDLEPLPWAGRWPRPQSCPLLQSIRGAVVGSLRPDPERLLYAEVSFWRGRRAVQYQLRAVARRLLGERFSEARLRVAVDAAYGALAHFERAMEAEGQSVIEGLARDLAPGAIAAVFVGRSYTLYDDDVSKRAMAHALRRNILAIPQDFLVAYVRGWYEGRIQSSLLGRKEDFDREVGQLVEQMDHLYPAQMQKMLSAAFAANYLNQRAAETGLPRLHLILQDPFKCGPNAMFRHYLDQVSGYLRLTMDEHTAPAGMITRLEAYRSTCRGRERFEAPTLLSARASGLADLDGREILVADASPHAAVFVALFRSHGLRSSLLPRNLDSDHALARDYVNGDECLPMIQNVQDFMAYLHGDGGARNGDAAFFQAWSCGPCRYGLYAPTQSLILNRAGFGSERICSVRVEDLLKQLGLGFVAAMFDGVLATDLLQKMLLATRPYEKRPGAADAAFAESLAELFDLLSRTRIGVADFLRGAHLGPFEDVLRTAAARFARVDRAAEGRRPKIIVAGEFYVRLDYRCCQDVVRRIEEAGGEALLSPAAEFLHYTSYINSEEGLVEAAQTRRPAGLLRSLMFGSLSRLGERDEGRLTAAAGPVLHEPPPAELRRLSRPDVPGLYAGELPMTIGRIRALAGRGEAQGVVAVAPFNCMRGLITECHLSTLREQLGLPMISLYYDGNKNPSRDEFIRSLVFQAGARLT